MAVHAKGKRFIGPRQICRLCKDPRKVLRADNESGVCHACFNEYRRKGKSGRKCSRPGCGADLRRDNTSGLCVNHRNGRNTKRNAVPCRVPGCPNRRLNSNFCAEHKAQWNNSPERQVVRRALFSFIRGLAKRGAAQAECVNDRAPSPVPEADRRAAVAS
jgi:hypothetical protein